MDWKFYRINIFVLSKYKPILKLMPATHFKTSWDRGDKRLRQFRNAPKTTELLVTGDSIMFGYERGMLKKAQATKP